MGFPFACSSDPFLSADEQGAILVSMNSRDMDLLLRFRPKAHVLLFKPATADVP